jgi:GR25 family glycosyltransferase involved in LPS biosynthesis
MENIDRIYYINLDRRPDRNIHFINQCKASDLPMDKVFRMRAIDGLTYMFSLDEETLFKNADFLHLPRTTVHKLMGNQLSHYYILHDIVRKNHAYSIILQDDAIFIPDFKTYIDELIPKIPDDAEIINLGLHAVAEYSYFEPWVFHTTTNDVDKISKEVVNSHICKMKPDMNPCSLAYIVTLQGAKNMIAYFKTHGFRKATDHNFNEYLVEKDIYYSSNTILVTGNPKLGSDIFT